MKRLLLILLSLTVLNGCVITRNSANPDNILPSDDALQSNESNINKSTSEDPPKITEREPLAKPSTQPIAQPATKPATQPITEPITQPVAKPVEKTLEPSVAPQISATSSSSMVVIGNKTKLRKSPSSKSAVIKTLKKGEVIQLIKQKDGWSLVELDGGETGWCAKGTLAQKR